MSVVAAAAVMAAEPIPASFENTPLATPNLMAFIIATVIVPHRPPPTALTENAILNIMATPAGRFWILTIITISPATT